MTRVAVLAIGDELLNGSLSDTNTATIARLLAARGFALSQSRAIGDDRERIAAALRQMTGEHDVLILTGGLGPTGDDLTAEAVALACGRDTVLNREALELVAAWFDRHNRTMHDRNRKSARLPAGAEPLVNPLGTAPGFTLTLNGCILYALPGVPDEMAAMIPSAVLPLMIARFGQPRLEPERVLTVFGIPEPQVEEAILQDGLPDGVRLAFGVEFPLVLVKLRADGPDAADRLDAAVARVEPLFAGKIVARGPQTIAEATAALLTERRLSLALAESCTGGLIGKMLTDIPGASLFLDRGAVTYSNRAKSDWLDVSPHILETDGAVSDACARAMAEGIRAAAGTDVGLSVTGVAGPDGGTPDKPVGTVFIALADRTGTTVERHRFGGDRGRVRIRTACAALALLQRHVASPSGSGT